MENLYKLCQTRFSVLKNMFDELAGHTWHNKRHWKSSHWLLSKNEQIVQAQMPFWQTGKCNQLHIPKMNTER